MARTSRVSRNCWKSASIDHECACAEPDFGKVNGAAIKTDRKIAFLKDFLQKSLAQALGNCDYLWELCSFWRKMLPFYAKTSHGEATGKVLGRRESLLLAFFKISLKHWCSDILLNDLSWFSHRQNKYKKNPQIWVTAERLYWNFACNIF